MAQSQAHCVRKVLAAVRREQRLMNAWPPIGRRELRSRVASAVMGGERPTEIVARFCPAPVPASRYCDECRLTTKHHHGICQEHTARRCDTCREETTHRKGICCKHSLERCKTCDGVTLHQLGICQQHIKKHCFRCNRMTIHKRGNCIETHARGWSS
ncbi:MAG: hypothetical protein Q7N87_02615 [Candidatus Uhrbacteria bacterium]|nr:hypothetical protein [Candidatus Uhrbacteria bacterium]